MRTLKCILLCIGHISVYLSITWTPHIQDYFDNQLADFVIAVGLALLLGIVAAYIVFSTFSQQRSWLTHVAIYASVMLYTVLLALIVVFLAPLTPERILHEFNLICGNIGVMFGVLVVYDNMKGAPIRDTYNDLMFELQQMENEEGGTGCGIDIEDKCQKNIPI